MLSDFRQYSSPRVVRCSELPLTRLKYSFSRQVPIAPWTGAIREKIAKPSWNVQPWSTVATGVGGAFPCAAATCGKPVRTIIAEAAVAAIQREERDRIWSFFNLHGKELCRV